MNAITDFTEADLEALQRSLQREAQAMIDANPTESVDRSRSYLVADFEYIFDRAEHQAWSYERGPERDDRDRTKHSRIRWPFHRVATASWLTLRFYPGDAEPVIGAPVVMTLEDYDEREIVSTLFGALEAIGHTGQLVTWGGETRDLAVLRHAACRHSLVLPIHLVDVSPNARERIDLCRHLCVQADSVHLDEYAAGSGIPAKPSPATEIGKLAEAGEWASVADHCLADVLTSSAIAVRWLSATGAVACDRTAAMTAITDKAFAAFPDSPFLQRAFKPWARAQRNASRLRGKVYRVTEPR